MMYRTPGADQREAREGDKLQLVFSSKEGFGFGVFAPDKCKRPIADQREAQGVADHADLGRTVWKSLRLARCISRADSVSDWAWAKRSSSASVTGGRR